MAELLITISTTKMKHIYLSETERRYKEAITKQIDKLSKETLVFSKPKKKTQPTVKRCDTSKCNSENK